MKLSGTAISAFVHLCAFGIIVLVVKAEPRLPTPIAAFVFGDEEKKLPAAPEPPKKIVEAPKPRAAPRAKERAVAPPPPAQVNSETAKTQPPPLDLGLVLDGDEGDVPDNAVVVSAALLAPADGLRGKTQLGALGGNVVQAALSKGPPPCAGELLPPVPTSRVEVEYPPSLPGLAGRVVAMVKVGPDGDIVGVELLEGVHPELDRAVLRSLQQWRFKAGRRCGKPSEGQFKVALRFETLE